jgi:beta-glucanase (GH16 family)
MKKILKHPIKETLKNYLLRWKAFRFYQSKPKGQRGMLPPVGYKKVFYDDFSNRLDEKKWKLGQPWGNFHPKHLYQHYDTEGKETYVSKENNLILEMRHRDLDIVKAELPDWRKDDEMPDQFTIPYAVGLVTTKESWQYGWFEAEIMLPKAVSLWPAFWLSGKNSWPPEIDIFEGYSKNGSDYKDRFLFKKRPFVKIQPNLHYGVVEEGTKAMYGAYDVPVWNATSRFVQYACWWEEDFIRIYYDGNMVFECTNPDVLKWFNGKDHEQFIIINNGVQDTGIEPNENAMLVRNVAVYQKT